MESDFSAVLTDGRAGFPALLDAIEAHLVAAGVPQAAAAPVLIAFDEVISNILDYGGAARVQVGLRVADARIAVEIADDGAAFNPIDAKAPDTTLSVEARDVGGLGIHLVLALMDSVAYERSAGLNHLRFSKAYSPAPAS
jgi:serine/threonine-protein kinase RsbW